MNQNDRAKGETRGVDGATLSIKGPSRDAATVDPVEAFAQLAEAANGRWDGVDVDKYVADLRG